jgi:hypothetical protein
MRKPLPLLPGCHGTAKQRARPRTEPYSRSAPESHRARLCPDAVRLRYRLQYCATRSGRRPDRWRHRLTVSGSPRRGTWRKLFLHFPRQSQSSEAVGESTWARLPFPLLISTANSGSPSLSTPFSEVSIPPSQCCTPPCLRASELAGRTPKQGFNLLLRATWQRILPFQMSSIRQALGLEPRRRE